MAAGTLDQRIVRRDFDTILFAESPQVHSVEKDAINLKDKNDYDFPPEKYYQYNGKKGRDRIFIYEDKQGTGNDDGKKVIKIEVVAKLPQKTVPGQKSSKFRRFHVTNNEIDGIEDLAARHENLEAWRKEYEEIHDNFAQDEIYQSSLAISKDIEKEMSGKVERYLAKERLNIIKDNAAADKIKKEKMAEKKAAADKIKREKVVRDERVKEIVENIKGTWSNLSGLTSQQRKKDSLDGIRTELKQNTLATIRQQVARCQNQEELDMIHSKMENELCNKKGSGELIEFRYNKAGGKTTAWDEYLFIMQSRRAQLDNNSSLSPESPEQVLRQGLEQLKNHGQLQNKSLVSKVVTRALMLCEDPGDVQSLKDELFRKNDDGSYVYLSLSDNENSSHQYPIINEKGEKKYTTKQANAIINLLDTEIARMWKGMDPDKLNSKQKDLIQKVEKQRQKKEKGRNKGVNQVRITEENNKNLADNYSSKEVDANTIYQRVMGEKRATILYKKLMLAQKICDARNDTNPQRRFDRLNEIEKMIKADKNSDYSQPTNSVEANLTLYVNKIVDDAEDKISSCCDVDTPREINNDVDNIDDADSVKAMLDSLEPLVDADYVEGFKQRFQPDQPIIDSYHNYEKELDPAVMLKADLKLCITINNALNSKGPNRLKRLQALDQSLAKYRGHQYARYSDDIEKNLSSFATMLFCNAKEDIDESGDYNMQILSQMSSGKEKADEMIRQLNNRIMGIGNISSNVSAQQNNNEELTQLEQLKQQKDDLELAALIFDMLIMEEDPNRNRKLYVDTVASLNEKLSQRDDDYVKYQIFNKKGQVNQQALKHARQQLCEYAVLTTYKAEKTLPVDNRVQQNVAPQNKLSDLKQRAIQSQKSVESRIGEIEDNEIIDELDMNVTKGGDEVDEVLISLSSNKQQQAHDKLPFFDQSKLSDEDNQQRSNQFSDGNQFAKSH